MGSEPLFVSERRRRISVASVKSLTKKYLCAAGRPDLSAHSLRHHFGTSLYARSGKLTVVQEALGHRDIATTARYARATEAEIRQAVESLPDNVYPAEAREEERGEQEQ
jgi:site-specific recombinase XerD